MAEARIDLVPGVLYRYELQDEDWTPVVVQTYHDLPTIGGMLWEQERRVLMRVNALNHPALPDIADGGYETVPSGGGLLSWPPRAPGSAWSTTTKRSTHCAPTPMPSSGVRHTHRRRGSTTQLGRGAT